MPIYNSEYTNNTAYGAVARRIVINVSAPLTGGLIWSFENDEGHTTELHACMTNEEFMQNITSYINNIIENL